MGGEDIFDKDWQKYEEYINDFNELDKIIGKRDLENPLQKIHLVKHKVKESYKDLYKVKGPKAPKYIKTKVRNDDSDKIKNYNDYDIEDVLRTPSVKIDRSGEYEISSDTGDVIEESKNNKSYTFQELEDIDNQKWNEIKELTKEGPLDGVFEANRTPFEDQHELIKDLLKESEENIDRFLNSLEILARNYEEEDEKLYESISIYGAF